MIVSFHGGWNFLALFGQNMPLGPQAQYKKDLFFCPYWTITFVSLLCLAGKATVSLAQLILILHVIWPLWSGENVEKYFSYGFLWLTTFTPGKRLARTSTGGLGLYLWVGWIGNTLYHRSKSNISILNLKIVLGACDGVRLVLKSRIFTSLCQRWTLKAP